MPSQAVLELLVQLKDTASAGLNALGGALSSVGGIAGGLALGGVTAFGAAVVSGIGDAREANQIMAQTEAVIKSTGGAAGFSAEQIADMAGELSAASGQSLFGDSDIQKGQNLLLTFTNIKDTLPDATQTMVDMAQALGTDVSGGAIQLGKALNDPIAGISALSRVGVTFTDEQKAQIQTMQEAGDMAGAQQVILAELNKEFGGSAAAAAQADGGWAQFNDRLGEATEGIGALLLPVLTVMVGILNDTVMPAIESVVTWLSTTADESNAAGQVVQTLSDLWEGTLAPALQDVFRVFQSDILPILQDLGRAVLPVVIAAIQLLAGIWQNVLGPVLSAAWGFFKDNILPILKEGAHWLGENMPGAVQALTDVFNNQILPAVRAVHGFLANTLWPALQTGATLAGTVGDAVGHMAGTFGGALTDALRGADGLLRQVSGWFGDIGKAADWANSYIRQVADTLKGVAVPAWLQGHSPPPMANWFGYIADAASAATDAMPSFDGADLALPRAPALTGVGAPGAASGGVAITIQNAIFQLPQGTTDAQVRAIREELFRIARNNGATGIT